TLIQSHENNINKINVFKKTWLLYHVNIYELIKKLKINKKIYNTSNIVRWIKNITQWSEIKTENYYIPSTLKYFTKTK
ncbi:MAG: hypothetical protein O4M80_05665, partial [Buchnera aphidicola]|nr:hypothetical protein [Buchnera aphidicola]